jgi:hypothetical protein
MRGVGVTYGPPTGPVVVSYNGQVVGSTSGPPTPVLNATTQ